METDWINEDRPHETHLSNTQITQKECVAHYVALKKILRGWRSATSNVLKYFQESKNPPSTHELEAVTRFINTASGKLEIEMENMKEKWHSIKQLKETSGNISNALASSRGCPETEKVGTRSFAS